MAGIEFMREVGLKEHGHQSPVVVSGSGELLHDMDDLLGQIGSRNFHVGVLSLVGAKDSTLVLQGQVGYVDGLHDRNL